MVRSDPRSGRKANCLAFRASNGNALALMLPFDEKSVRMQIATLDMPARDIIATIRHFAPGVVADG